MKLLKPFYYAVWFALIAKHCKKPVSSPSDGFQTEILPFRRRRQKAMKSVKSCVLGQAREAARHFIRVLQSRKRNG